MKHNIENCPVPSCQGTLSVRHTEEPFWFTACKRCGFEGPAAGTRDEAIELSNSILRIRLSVCGGCQVAFAGDWSKARESGWINQTCIDGESRVLCPHCQNDKSSAGARIEHRHRVRAAQCLYHDAAGDHLSRWVQGGVCTVGSAIRFEQLREIAQALAEAEQGAMALPIDLGNEAPGCPVCGKETFRAHTATDCFCEGVLQGRAEFTGERSELTLAVASEIAKRRLKPGSKPGEFRGGPALLIAFALECGHATAPDYKAWREWAERRFSRKSHMNDAVLRNEFDTALEMSDSDREEFRDD